MTTPQTVSFLQTLVTRRGLTALAAVTLGIAPGLGAQVGLSSGVAQVALVARIAPRAAIQGVGPSYEIAREGAMRDVSVSVRVLANARYKLVVVGTAPEAGARVWVRAAGGEFQELTSGTAITVAGDGAAAGEWERKVSYRIESPASEHPTNVLPVRYEVRVEPTI